MNEFDQRVRQATRADLHCADLSTIQVNVGLKCNLECVHCHVASSPRREEMMNWQTMEMILEAAKRTKCGMVDITGGAPEMNPDFCRFVEAFSDAGIAVMVRTNLTILLEPGYESMPEFFRRHKVQLVASMPCYLEENVDQQRGLGVFNGSIEAIKVLNRQGYGAHPDLPLSLVYNPIGPHLPPDQSALEEDYRSQLKERFDIFFTNLITITNIPIGRFVAVLRKQNKHREYMQLLMDSFNPNTIGGLMCRHQINVDWDGTIYDCDFNLALKMSVDHGAPTHIRDFCPEAHGKRRIVTGNHCFACTAGAGSSCGGALV